jgi:hypothetical protein
MAELKHGKRRWRLFKKRKAGFGVFGSRSKKRDKQFREYTEDDLRTFAEESRFTPELAKRYKDFLGA